MLASSRILEIPTQICVWIDENVSPIEIGNECTVNTTMFKFKEHTLDRRNRSYGTL